jgi:hypothetical protein
MNDRNFVFISTGTCEYAQHIHRRVKLNHEKFPSLTDTRRYIIIRIAEKSKFRAIYNLKALLVIDNLIKVVPKELEISIQYEKRNNSINFRDNLLFLNECLCDKIQSSAKSTEMFKR